MCLLRSALVCAYRTGRVRTAFNESRIHLPAAVSLFKPFNELINEGGECHRVTGVVEITVFRFRIGILHERFAP